MVSWEEEHNSLAEGDVREEVERVLQHRNRLLKVDDVCAEPVSKYEGLHVRIAQASFVAKMNTRIE